MRVLATAFALVAATTVAAEPVTPGEASAGAGTAAPPAAATSAAPPPAAATPPPVPRKLATDTPTQAVVDKLGLGDRLLLSGDRRGALFAYQDAVYAQPTYAPARVRLGRAYLALRYPDQAIAQAEAAIAVDPDSADARKLLDDARAAPPRPRPGASADAPGAAGPAAVVAAPPATPAAKPAPRVFKLSQDADAGAAKPAAPAARAASAEAGSSGAGVAPGGAATGGAMPAGAATPGGAATGAATAAGGTPGGAVTAGAATGAATTGGAAAGSAAALAAPVAVAAPIAVAATRRDADAPPAPEPTPAARKKVAAQHYRTALGFLQARDWAKAVAVLSDAIQADPSLAVAYSARGSAQYGLGRYRDAADDYGAAIRLDPKLATPVYGLAECYRVLGDGKKAAEMYERYAQSTASDVRDDLRAQAVKRAKELR